MGEGNMAKWYEAANEASFKRVPDGNVFQCPPTWLIGRSRYYLVSDERRAEIVVLMGRWRLLLIATMLTTFAVIGGYVLFMTPLNFLRIVEPRLHVDFGTFFMLATALMASVCALMIVTPQVYLIRSLRPLLADAPRTEQRIAMKEQFASIAATVSSKVVMAGMVGGLCLMAAAGFGFLDVYMDGVPANGRLPTPPLMIASALLLAGGLLTAYFVYLLRLKARIKQA
jgi:hypothetical protein